MILWQLPVVFASSASVWFFANRSFGPKFAAAFAASAAVRFCLSAFFYFSNPASNLVGTIAMPILLWTTDILLASRLGDGGGGGGGGVATTPRAPVAEVVSPVFRAVSDLVHTAHFALGFRGSP